MSPVLLWLVHGRSEHMIFLRVGTLLILSFFLLLSCVVAQTLDVGQAVPFGHKEIMLVRTGSDYTGNYALLRVADATSRQQQTYKVYEGQQKSTPLGLDLYVDSVSDDQGALLDAAIVYINGAEKSYLGSRLGDYWYTLREDDTIVFDGHHIRVVRINADTATLAVEKKMVELQAKKPTPVQGVQLLAHRIQRKGGLFEMTLRVHTLPVSSLPEKSTTKVVSLGTLSIIQGKMVSFVDFGKKSFSSPLEKVKKLISGVF